MSSIDHDRMVAGQLYRADAADLASQRRKARQLMAQFNALATTEETKRTDLLHQLFGAIGTGGYIEPNLRVDYGINTHIGQNFYANYDPIMLDVAPITIGDNVLFGPRVSLLTPGHPLDADIRNSGVEYAQPITIGNNVWLGGDVTVLPGVTIGDNTIVGAGSVVTKDLPDAVIAVGNPAHVLRALTAADHDRWVQAKAEYDAAVK
ncbi:sugar O-acetyltransferase [Lacticaseibacillus salsurivasis]|uniref:sugar O-acetyltransferase n=1 Tax=Lacticaseibacillus salsurivasis TaxID=3081441 RepID=UPI0030C6F4E7